MRAFIVCLICLLLAACGSSPKSEAPDSQADKSNSKIRFYRVNSKGQQTGLTVVKNTNLPGCHNLFKESQLHRIAVKGFAYCEVYADKDCKSGTALSAQWLSKRVKSEEKKQPVIRFTKGSRWVLDREGNVRARSWRCVDK